MAHKLFQSPDDLRLMLRALARSRERAEFIAAFEDVVSCEGENPTYALGVLWDEVAFEMEEQRAELAFQYGASPEGRAEIMGWRDDS